MADINDNLQIKETVEEEEDDSEEKEEKEQD